jgi:UDP-N-acetylglucosamine/UDP-N-acetylgalactosamine diphosphorylase
MTVPFSDAERETVEVLQRTGNDHVLRWVDELADADRTRFMQELAAVDERKLRQFGVLIGTPPTDVSFVDVRPAPVERLPIKPADVKRERKIVRLGQKALGADRVAVVTVAGGQGTRLRYDHPKGMYPISPLKGKSLFQLFAEEILANRRRYGAALPWLIMTSPTNDEETRAFFAENDYFGLGGDSVHFFAQHVNPILDPEGRLFLAEKGRLLVGPDGHGGTFTALAESGLLDMLRTSGLDLISYFQVDNPLVTALDPRFIGHHLRRGADFSCKVVPKRDPEEGLGLAVVQGGRAAVIEYVDVPPEIAAARLPSGKLRLLFGSIAIHVMDVPFVERVVRQTDGLPWHIARKQYKVVGEDGVAALTPPRSCFKFEQFIFDAIAFADKCAFVETSRDSEFAPVKNFEGADSPDSARRMMQRCWLGWLKGAGASVDVQMDLSTPQVEISPLFALDAEELKEKVEPEFAPEFPLLLEP